MMGGRCCGWPTPTATAASRAPRRHGRAAALRHDGQQPRRPPHPRGTRRRPRADAADAPRRLKLTRPIDDERARRCLRRALFRAGSRHNHEESCMPRFARACLAVRHHRCLAAEHGARRRRHVDLRRLPRRQDARRLWLRARPGMARPRARRGGAADRRLLGQLRLGRGADPHQPSLRRAVPPGPVERDAPTSTRTASSRAPAREEKLCPGQQAEVVTAISRRHARREGRDRIGDRVGRGQGAHRRHRADRGGGLHRHRHDALPGRLALRRRPVQALHLPQIFATSASSGRPRPRPRNSAATPTISISRATRWMPLPARL